MKAGLGESLSIKRSTDGALVPGGIFSAECSAQAASSKKIRPEIIEGTLDLTEWHLQIDGPAALGGQWLFGWEQSLPPAFEWAELQAHLSQRFSVPRVGSGGCPSTEGRRTFRPLWICDVCAPRDASSLRT